MDKNKLLEISNIKNLQSITITTLMDTKENKDPSLIIAFYDDGKKSLSYCEFDKEYKYFFSTVRRVYSEEKLKRKIYIDNLSKNILEANEPKIELDKLKSQIGSIGENKKINYNIYEVERHYNILKYLLEKLFTHFNKHIEIKSLKGMNKHFKFTYKEEILEENLQFTFIEKDNNNYTFIFPGIFTNNKELYIDLEYKEKIIAKIHDKEEQFLISYEVETTPDYGKITESLFINGLLSSKIINELESIEKPKLYDYELEGTTYILPWNDTRSIVLEKNENELITETVKYQDYFNYNNHIQIRKMIIQYITKKGYKKEQAGVYKIKGDLKIQTDDELIITNYYKVDNYIIKETTFISNGLSRGIFKSELEGKSFYKIYELKDKNTLEPINEEIIKNIKGYELINEKELKLLIKRRGL